MVTTLGGPAPGRPRLLTRPGSWWRHREHRGNVATPLVMIARLLPWSSWAVSPKGLTPRRADCTWTGCRHTSDRKRGSSRICGCVARPRQGDDHDGWPSASNGPWTRRPSLKQGYEALLAEAETEVGTLPVEQALRLHGDGNVVLFDLRDPRAIERDGRIPGCFPCPRGLLEFWVDPERPLCEAGAHGAEALPCSIARAVGGRPSLRRRCRTWASRAWRTPEEATRHGGRRAAPWRCRCGVADGPAHAAAGTVNSALPRSWRNRC